MRSVHALSVALLLLQVACSGGGATDPREGSPATPETGDPTVGLTVQWPAAFANTGDVHASAITLPSQVNSLDMTIQVLGADFPGRTTEVQVSRVDGVDVTTINGVADESGLAGITISVPVGDPRRVFITGSAELTGPRTVSFSGFVDLTVTADPDQRATVTLFEEGGGQVPTFETVDPTTPTGLHVGDATDLIVVAAFDDGFQVDRPGGTYSSSDTGVATVDEQGHVTIVGPGTAIITITVGGVTVEVTVIVENTAPVLAAVADQSDDDGATVSLALSASDVDDDALTFTATGLPTGLAIDAATGEISGTIDPAAARTNAVSVTVSDGQDEASQDFTWAVIDITDPVVTAPAPATVEAVDGSGTPAGDAAIQAFLAGATAMDNVDGALVPTNNGPATFPLGATVVTWSATDGAGNTGTATQTVTVTDTTAPVVTAPLDVTVEATGAQTAVLLGAGTANDLVDGALVPTPDDPGPFAVGIHVVTWSATDGAGNAGTATQTVTVTDTTAPVVTAPVDVTVEAMAALTPVALGAGTAIDLADGALVPTPDDPGPFAVGIHVVTWSATDGTGNTGTATQTVTVTDTTAPTVTPPADITVEATELPMPVALGAGTAIDLVDGALVPTPDDLGPFAIGAHVVTWSATDGAANTGTATQTVTVTDTTPPAVTLIFPLGGIVGATTDVTVLATDLNGVDSVLINNVGAVKDAVVADQWTAPNVPVPALATDLTAVATDTAPIPNATPALVLTTVDNGDIVPKGSGPDEFQSLGDLVLEVDGNGSVTGVVVADEGSLPSGLPVDVHLGSVLRVDPTTGARTQVAGPVDFSFSDSLVGGDVDTFTIFKLTPGDLTPGTNFYAWTYNAVGSPFPDTLLGTFDDANGLIASNDDFSPIGDGLASGLAGTVNASGNIVLKVTGYTDTNFDGLDDSSGAAHGITGSYQLFVAVAAPDGANPFITPDAVTINAASELFVLDGGVDNTGAGGGYGAVLSSDGSLVSANADPSGTVWADLTVDAAGTIGGVGDLLIFDQTECSNLIQVDPVTGAQSLVFSGMNPCYPLAIDVDATSLLAAGDLFPPAPDLYRVPADGNGAVFSGGAVGSGTAFNDTVNVAVAPDGQLWVVDGGLAAVFAVDPVSGDRTLFSGGGAGLNGPLFYSPMAVAVDSRGRVFIVALGDDSSFCTYAGVWQINSAVEDLGVDGTQPFGSRALISTTLLTCGGSG